MAESIIPLSQVILSTRIVEMVKKYDPDFNGVGFKIVNDRSFPLNDDRLSRILQGIDMSTNLPPVDLQPKKLYIPPKKRQTNLLYFTVVNGRHRVAASLIRKKSHIRAVLRS